MRLQRVILEQFRGYKERTEIDVAENLTAVTGRNDAGKSSILEALDVFFDGGEISFEKTDISVGGEAKEASITCIFDGLPAKINIDAVHETSLQDEHLLHEDGCLWVEKRYSGSGNPKVFLHALHPTAENYDDLHALSIRDLKKRAKMLEVDDETVADKRISAHWRRAIWEHSSNRALKCLPLAINDLSKDAKDLYGKLERLFPIFALFRSDRESRDNDPHAKAPLQEAVKQAQTEFQDEIVELQQKIQGRVIERANATIEKLEEMDPSLAERLHPRFRSPPKWSFDFSLDGDGDIPINKRGSGVRRLILLNFFRAEAERSMVAKCAPSVIYAIEEPETSQHPSNQQLLVESLLAISCKENCQVLITTHVPALAGLLPVEGLRFIEQVDGTSRVHQGSDDVLDRVAESLGVLPEAGVSGAKALVLVEGPSDIVFLNHTAHVLCKAGHIDDTLEGRSIVAIWIGGCGNLKHWVTKKIADKLQIRWGMLLDSDRGTDEEDKNRQQIAQLCEDTDLVFLTRKREPENYLLPEAVSSDPSVQQQLQYTDTCDAKKLIGSCMKVRTPEVLERYWPNMTATQIRSVEAYEDGDGNERFELTEMLQQFLALA